MKKLLLFIFLVSILPTQAQISFEKTYCFASTASAFTCNYDSGFIVICGDNQSQKMMIRLNKYGDTIWYKSGFHVNDCEISNDTNIVTINLLENGDLAFTKSDQLGNTILEKKLRSYPDVINDIMKTPDNGYLLTGAFYNINTFEYVAGFIKTNANGDTIWSQVFNDGNINTQEAGYYSVTGSDGNYYFCGISYAFGVLYQPSALLIGSLTPQGGLRYAKIFSNNLGNFPEYTGGIISLPSGGFMVCTTCDTNENNINVIRLYKFTNICDTIWCRKLAVDAKESAGYGMCLTEEGSIALAGNLKIDSANTTIQQAYFAKIDTAASIIWDRQMGSNFSEFRRVCPSGNNGITLIGKNVCSNNSNACYLVQTDENGLVTGLEERPTAQQKALYALEPNPLTDQNLVLNAYEGFGDNIQLELLSGNGQRVYHAAIGPQPGKKQLSIHLPALAKGLYLLQLRHQSQPSKNCALKLIIN
jgi:hypothetical protein